MANQIDTISFATLSKFHQHNPSFDSHLNNKINRYPSNLDLHLINREIYFIADYALKLKLTTQTNSDLYKYIIRIAEISIKAEEVDNNKKLLDDLVEELSILLTHSLKSKTIQLFLIRLIYLYKKKQSNFNNTQTDIKNSALFFNNQLKNQNNIFTNLNQSSSAHKHYFKSQSPVQQNSNSKIFQLRQHDIQNHLIEDPNNFQNEYFKAILFPPMISQRSKNCYLNKY
ncbi:unnamed protein product [Paramecium sonneborni]|uniref:Uncharacterized protein n=1 Tax=Paramecium sonneborni TaxID=65129 RepID=A0A8S1RJT2_9CILI|nr:unnamed protein product [Paramecium sonneborni]